VTYAALRLGAKTPWKRVYAEICIGELINHARYDACQTAHRRGNFARFVGGNHAACALTCA
ncbi:MAG: hypothetical protein WBM84_22065, partial [Sedimenticolaceae bacterium]